MRQPSIFFPHGGGPGFFMNPDGTCDSHFLEMEAYLKEMVSNLPERPKAILLISAHWEEPQFTVHHGERPDPLYDYWGFPAHTYALRWDAPGAPALARRVAGLLDQAGFETAAEQARGWDHGVFIPLMVAVPDADIPLVQLSLRNDLDPEDHIGAGRALAPLRDEGVLILGSGLSFHNLGLRGGASAGKANAWDEALTSVLTDPDPATRIDRLSQWHKLPFARYAHPREEHLIPLMVNLGAAENDPCTQDHHSQTMGWTVSGYRFG